MAKDARIVNDYATLVQHKDGFVWRRLTQIANYELEKVTIKPW